MKKCISFILPIYNESENVELFHKTLSTALESLAPEYSFEFLYINDGSKDSSLEVLYSVSDLDARVKVINFSRNYGHQMAVTAGLDYAAGDAGIIMDTDLQDPPNVCLQLIEKWQQGFDVVYAQRGTRKDSFFKKLTAKWFYQILSAIADIDIPKNTGDFRLIDKKVILELRKFKEHNRFLRGMVSFVGFKQTAVIFDRDERNAGTTGYPLKKMIRFAADGIFGFSNAPLKAISRLGYLIALLSVLGIIYVLFIKLFNPEQAVEGWAFTVISIFLVGGIQLIMLGVLGSYIGRVYTEVQGRPLYTIESIKSGSNDNGASSNK